MIVAAAFLAYSLGAHFQYWGPPAHEVMGKDKKMHMVGVVQKGVSIGAPRVDERLILYSHDGTCKGFVRFAGRHGDLPQAKRFLSREMGCHLSARQLRVHKAVH